MTNYEKFQEVFGNDSQPRDKYLSATWWAAEYKKPSFIDTSTLGGRIKYEMAQMNYSQKQLAECIGTTETSVSRWINNTRKPNSDMLYKICKVLFTSADYLLFGEEENE